MALTDIDRELLKKCVAEQPGAWRDFVDRFIGLFVHVVRHTGHARSVKLSDDDVDDICAEIFLALVANDHRILRSFRGEASLATYLAVVARRIAVREIIRRRTSEALGHVNASAVQRVPDRTAAQPQQRIDDRDQVERMLAGLGGKDADIVRLYHLEGRTYREIAAHTGLPEPTIGSTLSRARARIRRR